MADLTITTIQPSSSRSRAVTATAGEAIDAGELIYQDSADSKMKLADASAAATATLVGVALTSAAADGDFLVYQASESVDLGAILTAGTFYYMSANAGKIAPHADLVSTNVVSAIGYATSTSLLTLSIANTGAVIA